VLATKNSLQFQPLEQEARQLAQNGLYLPSICGKIVNIAAPINVEARGARQSHRAKEKNT